MTDDIKMVKKKVTLTLEPKAITRLQTLAKRENRSMSNMIEVLAYAAYDSPELYKLSIARQKINELK